MIRMKEFSYKDLKFVAITNSRTNKVEIFGDGGKCDGWKLYETNLAVNDAIMQFKLNMRQKEIEIKTCRQLSSLGDLVNERI